MREMLNNLIKRRSMLEEGVIPFVEPCSVAEELAFNELFFINNQINSLIREEKRL